MYFTRLSKTNYASVNKITLVIIAICSFCSTVFAQNDKQIEPKRLLKDFKILEEIITAHPDPYTHTSEQAFTKALDSVKNTLNEPLSELEFYKKTAFILALIKDGHSSAYLPPAWMEKQRKAYGCFPYEMHLTNSNELYILKNFTDQGIKPGVKIISINDISIDSFLSKISPYISYELEPFRNTIIDNRFELYLNLSFDISKGITLKYVEKDTLESTVQNISITDWKKHQKDNREIREKLMAKGEPYEYQNIGEGIGILSVYGFSTSNFNSYNLFLQKTFKQIKRDSIHSLVIDIRGNYGGWPKIASELFHYIYGNYFKTMAKSSVKVSQAYQDVFYKAYPILKMNKPTGLKRRHFVDILAIVKNEPGTFIHESEFFNEEPIEERYEFSGDVYLMTNRDSYSAASSFASTFQCYNMGIIIGEETGGTKIFRANSIYQRLDYSGVNLQISTTKLFTPCYTEESMGVIPNIEYSPSIFELLSGIDTQLSFTKRIIKKVQKKRKKMLETSEN